MALFNKTKEELLPEQFPEHIAFIMDGNGRWAKKRGLPRKFRHREGAKTFKKITRYCKDIGIKNITFYAFSTENWKRPEDEVSAIIELFREYIVDVRNYIGEEVRVLFLGDKTIFDDDLQKKMNDLEEDTKDYNKMTMLLAINYGGRDEIVHAAKILSEQVKRGEIQPDEITEDMFQKYLYTADVPDVDLMIRPSGELRLSNFLIWQSAYAEFYFTDVLWPDFSPNELDKALISVVMVYEVLKAARCTQLRLTCIPALLYAAVNPFIVTGEAAKYKFTVTFIALICIFTTYIIQHNSMKYYRLMFIIASSLLISNAMSSLIILHDIDKVNGLMYLIMGLCGAWLADSGAYFVGTFIGKKKLCPEISPKKTVEGFVGGIFITGLLFMLINFGYSKILPHFTEYTVSVNYFEVCVLGMILAVVGTLGDLSASVVKRQCGIKDYGNIMPGHGGLMDRFDSVVFVAPCLYAFVTIFNIYK